jgi:hypothetical protein
MNHGAINGGVTTTTNRHNKLNKALEFDGSGYIDIPTLSGLQYKPISYSVWLYIESYLPSSAGHKFMSIIGRQEQFNIECGMLGLFADTNVASGLYDNTFLYWMGASSTPDVPSSLAKPEINKWTHLVFTQDSNGAFKLYLNGNLVNSGSLTNAQTANISFRIGAGIDANFYPWIGKLDDIRIYNRVLNNDEIQILSQE